MYKVRIKWKTNDFRKRQVLTKWRRQLLLMWFFLSKIQRHCSHHGCNNIPPSILHSPKHALLLVDAWCMMLDTQWMMNFKWSMIQDARWKMDDAWYKIHQHAGRFKIHDTWCILDDGWCILDDGWCMIHDAADVGW